MAVLRLNMNRPSSVVKKGGPMEDVVNIIANNGIGVVCVAYLIYFQSTTMKEMLNALNGISERLAVIESKLEGEKE